MTGGLVFPVRAIDQASATLKNVDASLRRVTQTVDAHAKSFLVVTARVQAYVNAARHVVSLALGPMRQAAAANAEIAAKMGLVSDAADEVTEAWGTLVFKMIDAEGGFARTSGWLTDLATKLREMEPVLAKVREGMSLAFGFMFEGGRSESNRIPDGDATVGLGPDGTTTSHPTRPKIYLPEMTLRPRKPGKAVDPTDALLNPRGLGTGGMMTTDEIEDLIEVQIAGVEKVKATVVEAQTEISQFGMAVHQQITSLVGTIASGIGEAFFGLAAGAKNAGRELAASFVGAIGQMSMALGSFLVSSGLGIEALKGLQGAAAIAAGTALLALGGVLQGAAGALRGAGGGGRGVAAPTTAPDLSAFRERHEDKRERVVVLNVNTSGRDDDFLGAFARMLERAVETGHVRGPALAGAR